MKVAVISDLHYGVRGDATMFLDHQKKFLDDVFFPTLVDKSVMHVIIPGDLVDRRKYINYNTLHRLKTDFLNPLSKMQRNAFMIPGNHDEFHKNTGEICALQHVLSGYQRMEWYSGPFETSFGGTSILFLPWINAENFDGVMRAIQVSKSEVCVAHLELAGFEMHAGQMSTHGLDKALFKKFKLVITGHFHKISKQDNIHYVGAPWEMTWNDYDCPRGFHILDTDTLEMEFIRNPYSMFQRVIYNDKGTDIKDILEIVDRMHFSGVYCKVLVEEKTNPYWFDLFVSRIESKGPFDLKIIDQTQRDVFTAEDIDEAEDTPTIIARAVDRLENVSVDKNDLKNLFNGLYKRAVLMEV